MRRFVFFVCITILGLKLFGQEPSEKLIGQVSFISSQNIYVKFKSTDGISIGDTLYLSVDDKYIPALKVNNMSSTSCICTNFSTSNLSQNSTILAKARKKTPKPEVKIVENTAKSFTAKDTTKQISNNQKDGLKQNIKGSITVNSYSDFSNTTAPNSQRLRYTLSLDAKNINDSKFSVESYISFKHKIGDWKEVDSNIFNALKIYNLSVKYEPNKTTQFILGRRINPRITSIGAIDGLQVEKSFHNFIIGGAAGSRPNYSDYGFNAKLLQFGAYIAYNTKSETKYTESSFAVMQQMNDTKIDRRFLYFQHSNSLVKNLYFYSTLEVDLYKLQIDTLNHTENPQNTLNPIGLYLSLRYKMTKRLTILGSYDARKNVIYYETYKSYIDHVLETELRQGFRLQANYRISQNIMLGLQSGYRFLKTDPKPSKNAYGYLTYTQIPWLNITATISGTYLESNYLKGNILGVSLSRDFFKGNFQTGIGYRLINYNLPNNQVDVKQDVGEMNITWLISRSLFFSINYEGTIEKRDKFNRFYLQLRYRF